MKLQKYVHRSVARSEYILLFDSFYSLEFVLFFVRRRIAVGGCGGGQEPDYSHCWCECFIYAFSYTKYVLIKL